MANNGKKGQHLAKAALARVSRVETGDTSTTDARVSPMAQSIGITFDANNNVNNNVTNNRVSANESDIALLETKMNSLAILLGVTFNPNGTINTEAYSTHTHSYGDATINDTADGTGVEAVATKTTDGVS